MGRKKKPKDDEPATPHQPRHRDGDGDDDDDRRSEKYRDSSDDDSSDFEVERRHHDIHADIQELASTFGIDFQLTQSLNDIMIDERKRTWKQDLDRLYEILKEARTPAAVLRLKLKDMEKGKFVGKAICGPKVRELCRKHRLDKGATAKFEEAMSMREAMGKDVDKDMQCMDEHLAASNAPSKLVSMKLEALRKGYNLGHCIYSREMVPGNQGPGVDGVFDQKSKRPLGYTDADLDRRFAEQSRLSGGGQLMDEATVMKMMKAERLKVQAGGGGKDDDDDDKRGSKKKDKGRSRSRSRRGRKRSRSKSSKSRSHSGRKAKKGGRSPSKSRSKRQSPSRGKKKSRSRSPKRKQRAKSRSRSGSRSARKGKVSDKKKG